MKPSDSMEIPALLPLPAPPDEPPLKKVYIMRGFPGVGKSHWMKANCPLRNVCSADQYHMELDANNPSGWRYDFKPERARWAHDQCLLKFVSLVAADNREIVVDNTNISLWEIAPYYRIAEANGYDVEIINLTCPIELAKARGTHNVPDASYVSMLKRHEAEWHLRPKWWKVREVQTGTAEDLMELLNARRANLTANITDANRQPEVNFGPPVGKEVL